MVKNPPAMWETWFNPWVGKQPTATHSSILAWRIPIDKEAWQTTVHGVAKSPIRLSNFTFTFHFSFGFSSTRCCCLVAKSCQTLCEPMDCGPPGCSIHGISQAKKARFGGRGYGQRPLKTQEQKSLMGGAKGQKAWVLGEV